MSPNPIFTPLMRPLRPLLNAIDAAQNAARRPGSLYTAPSSVIAGLDDSLWPNPMQPITPMGPPRAEPLAWPFDWGRNIIFTPREDSEYSAHELRQLSMYPLARICIENNKDMITRMPHRVQLKPLPGETSKDRANRSKGDKNLKFLNAFFDKPNPEQDWQEFLRPVLEDMLVIDAASIFIGRTGAGKVAELRWVEGASITKLIDEHGWSPPKGQPAYQQNWQGYPRIDLTTDQLIYRPRNIVPRNTQSGYIYGCSPTEQIAKEIKIGMSRLQFVWDFYASGSVPGLIQFAPVGTHPDKIKEAQGFLDSELAGRLGKRRQARIFQGFQKEGHSEQIVQPHEPALADLFDEVHTRKICFAYGTSPQRLMRQMNRASANAAQESAEEEGTLPWMAWLKSLIDHIIQDILGFPEYEFAFDPFHEMDRMKQSQADSLDVDNGLYTVNEVRERRGDDPRPEPDADVLNVKTTMGFIPLGSVAQTGGTNNGAVISKPQSAQAAQDRGSSTITTKSIEGCAIHKSSYPRTFCVSCMSMAKLHVQEEQEEQEEFKLDVRNLSLFRLQQIVNYGRSYLNSPGAALKMTCRADGRIIRNE